MVACIHPVCVHRAQILYLKLDQALRQFLLVSQANGERVGFEFEFPRQDIHKQLYNGIHWRQCVGEKYEADYDRMLVVKAEG